MLMKSDKGTKPSGADRFADHLGRFGRYGGQYVPETLMPALHELAEQYDKVRQDHQFQEQLSWYLRYYVGRPSPIARAPQVDLINLGYCGRTHGNCVP